MNKLTRLVIYTVLLGDKEKLGSPLSLLNPVPDTDLELDFICFTDNKALTSDTWKFIYIEDAYLPPEKLSRRPKALPHDYLSDWEYSLYIDNIVTFKRLPNRQDLSTSQAYLFKMFRHAFRENLYQEADAIAMLGYDDVKIIGKQIDFYSGLVSIDSIHPIHTCTVMFREHNHPEIIRHGKLWWENFLCFSKRDQMSFDFAVKQSGCLIEALPGFKHDNDIINGTNNAHDNRIKANFDEVKYAWLNRHLPEAVNNPKAHFLADSNATGDEYAKRIHLFEHICHRYQSSLGQDVAPRRSVTDSFDGMLASHRGKGGNCLLVRISDTQNAQEFLEEELGPAAQAISILLNPYAINTFEVGIDELSDTSTVFNRTEDFFDIIIVLGIRSESTHKAFEKFSGLLNQNQGTFCILTGENGQINLINDTYQAICQRFSEDCDVSINCSQHDNLNHPILNSLVYYQWGFKNK